MTDKSLTRPFNDSHANNVYEDALLRLNELADMEYESEYARAMALKPHRDLINSLDTARNDGYKEGFKLAIEKCIKQGIEPRELLKIAKKMLAKDFDIKTIIKITGLTEEIILQ